MSEVRTIDRIYMRLHRWWMPPGRRQTWFDRWGVRFWTKVDVFVFTRLGWSPVARMMGVDVLRLETRGRRSGLVRRAMVACLAGEGDSLVIGGGNWGWDRDPGWYYNLQAEPLVRVTRGKRTVEMRATALAGEEADKARDALAAAYPHSQQYVSRRTRPVPVARLDPT